jgi:hypothetical protein
MKTDIRRAFSPAQYACRGALTRLKRGVDMVDQFLDVVLSTQALAD